MSGTPIDPPRVQTRGATLYIYMNEETQQADLGIHKWMHENNIVNEKGEPLTFSDHMFLFDPYDDFSQYQVYKKCSQVGLSVMMNVKVPYAMKHYGWNVIYTLPADSDVWEFVPTKTDEIIRANPQLLGMLQSVDKVELKKIADRFWHFKGTRSKTAAIMTTADLLIHDEKDRSDLGVIGQYRSRIKRSKFKGVWELSNPSVKNAGIDVTWGQSDQKEWMVKCSNCELEQPLDWAENINYRTKEYVCRQCGSILDQYAIRLGKWQAMSPDSEISGYHINQMMAPWLTCGELIKEEAEQSEEYFYNFILGDPVGGESAYAFRQYIIDAWTAKSLKDSGPHFMGIDIGSTKHYVVGNKDGIHTIGHVRTRTELENIIEYWNPTVVMDAGPERTWAEEFRIKYPKLWIAFYKPDKDKKKLLRWGDPKTKDAGIVLIDRNRTIDKALNAIIYGDLQFALESRDLESYIKHWEVMSRQKELNKLKQWVYRWVKTPEHAADHYVHATAYYYAARSRGATTDFVQSQGAAKKPSLIIPKQDGGETIDLEAYMERKRR